MADGAAPRRTDDATPSGAPSGAQGPGLKDVVRASLDAEPNELWDSLRSMRREPCLREALAWGFGLGTLFALHRYKQAGNLLKATNTFVTATTVSSAVSWTLCRKHEVDSALEMRQRYSGGGERGDPFLDDDAKGSARENVADSARAGRD